MSEELKLLPCPFCGGCNFEITQLMSGVSRVLCLSCGGMMAAGIEGNADARWNTRSAPPLLRVSPEDLVEGKRYVYNYHHELLPMIGTLGLRNGRMVIENSHDSDCDCIINEYVQFWGPLPEFELE